VRNCQMTFVCDISERNLVRFSRGMKWYYIFCSDRAFFRPFCSYLGLRGSSPTIWASYVSSWRNTRVGGAKIPVKKKTLFIDL